MTETTATHRPGCTRPGWTLDQSRSLRAVAIAHCDDCGAIELREEGANR